MSENKWISDLHWRREGKQSRSEKTQSALIDAAEALILSHGAEAVSVADIVKAAGSSTGSFYHHFKDKTALYYALYNRMAEDLKAISEDAMRPDRWAGAGIADILRGFIEFSLRQAEERPAFKAAALLVAGELPELRTHYARQQTEMYQALAALILERRSDIGHPDPDRAVAFVLNQLDAMLRNRLDTSLSASQLETGSDEEFIADALQSACLFLQVRPTQD